MFQFEQGGLDSLCGIYSLVNAERMINLTSRDDSQELFNSIVKYLEKKDMLAKILTEGMYLKHIKMILNDVIGNRIPYSKPHFAGVSNPDLNTFWQEITNFLNNDSNLETGPKRVVLLSMSGVHDHWTLIKSISEKQIQLFDSMGLRHLNRNCCTTADSNGKRIHVLYPAQTYFFSGEE